MSNRADLTDQAQSTFDLDALHEDLRTIHDSGALLVFEGDLKPGDWLDIVNAFFLAQLAACGARQITHEAPIWHLALDGPLPRLHPIDALPDGELTVLLPAARNLITIKTLLWLYHRRITHLWILEHEGWMRCELESLLAQISFHRRIKPLLRRIAPGTLVAAQPVTTAMAQWLRRRHDPANPLSGADVLLAPARHDAREDEDIWNAEIEKDNEQFTPRSDIDAHAPLNVLQYTGCLNSGGAERQLCNVALELARRGHTSQVRTQHDLEGPHGHYRPLLDSAGVSARRAGLHTISPAAIERVDWKLLTRCPADIRSYVVRLALELAHDPPDVLHGWLDHPNVIAALAGIAARIDCILLSTRNYNPTHFPRFYAPFVDWYRVAARSRRVHFLANSHAGAQSYADYIGIDVDRFHVVYNGLFREHFDRPDETRRRKARQQFNIPAQVPVIAVVNRLDDEKQPQLMLKVIALLRDRLPDLRVLVAGAGPLEAEVRSTIHRRGLGSTIQLLGRVSNVVDVLSASDVLLLTSKYEGCPNVALEAQHIGVPVVATDAGGTPDAVAHDVTGFIRPTNDAPGLVMDLRRLLTQPLLREQFAIAAQQYVDASFNLDLMVDHTIDVYHTALSAGGQRIVTPKPDLESLKPKQPAPVHVNGRDGSDQSDGQDLPLPFVKTLESQSIRL